MLTTAEQRRQHIAAYIRIGGQHMPNEQAAREVGVSERTIERYRAALTANPGLARPPREPGQLRSGCYGYSPRLGTSRGVAA